MDAKTLNKLRFHLDRLVLGTSAVPEEDWQKLDVLVPAALRAPHSVAAGAVQRKRAPCQDRQLSIRSRPRRADARRMDACRRPEPP